MLALADDRGSTVIRTNMNELGEAAGSATDFGVGTSADIPVGTEYSADEPAADPQLRPAALAAIPATYSQPLTPATANTPGPGPSFLNEIDNFETPPQLTRRGRRRRHRQRHPR